MPQRSSKKRAREADPKAIAFDVLQQATWEDEGGDGNRCVEPTPNETPEFQEPSEIVEHAAKGRSKRSDRDD